MTGSKTAKRTSSALPPGPYPRRFNLDGAVNFRDLGGYRTSDGRQLRWGHVFRSDQLADASHNDLALLADLGIRSLCDLRAPSEQMQKPNRLWQPAPQTHDLGFMPYRGDELIEGARAGTLKVEEISRRVAEIYRRFALEQVDTYARLLALLSDEESWPLLIHCTSGRDRTGFACAVILSALNVPRQTILEDYVLSEQYRRDLAFQMGNSVNAEVMAALTNAKPEYLNAAFEAIENQWGNIDNYLSEALGLTTARRQALQEIMLEPVQAQTNRQH